MASCIWPAIPCQPFFAELSYFSIKDDTYHPLAASERSIFRRRPYAGSTACRIGDSAPNLLGSTQGVLGGVRSENLVVKE
jgi:hypothetical protein